jgi:glycosyltransferase involved in cell wall biosynthesis
LKRLLFIHSLGGGGAERVAATLANRWVQSGRHVTVVTLAPMAEDLYQLDPGVVRIALDQASQSSGVFGAMVANIRRVVALRRVLLAERPDAAVAMMSTMNALLAIAGMGMKPMLSIGSERTHPPNVPLGWWWERLRARTYGLLDAVVVLTAESRAWVETHTSARQVTVIPNPVVWPLALQGSVRAPDSVGSPSRKRLLAVGRLDRQKGFEVLIEVFARLAATAPDWELVIAGEGPERERLQEQIDHLGIGESVFLAGHVGNIGDWYQSADLYVLTSRFEGFPNVLVEALAHGVPAVSVDCDTGPRDILRPEIDGLLVPPQDDVALAAALSRLMSDGATRQAFAVRAAEARTRFSLELVCDAWEQLLSGLRG